jgi:hypothetical protein
MRLGPSLKMREPNGRSTLSRGLRLGERRERRLAIVELLVTRTGHLIPVDREQGRPRRSLLEDNPTSG